MKMFFWSCFVILFLAPCTSFAFHSNNYSETWSCELCHPGGPGVWIPECIECHNNDTGMNYTDTSAPQMTTHSSETLGTAYGNWMQECVDCHDPHHNNGITMVGGVETSEPSRILAEFTADYAATVDSVTTMDIVSAISVNDSMWADPATWGAKTGNSERGLVLLVVIQDKTYWYEVLSATSTSITFSNGATFFPQAPMSNPQSMKLAYGMFIQDEIGPFPVVYSGPRSLAYNEGKARENDPTPTGVCQVCHTQTKFWRSDGSRARHQNGKICTTCHLHVNGFKPNR